MVRTSVIIPTRDGRGPLRACLRALVPSFPADAETIVVADGCAVDSGSVVADFCGPLRLRWIQAPHGGPAAARNLGLAAARGEIAAFTDDDCRPRPGWVRALAEGVALSPPRAAGGTTFNGREANAYADAAQVVLDLVARHDLATYGEERFFPCNNCAFPVAPLRELGGFDESFRTAEDRELCRRWRQAGYLLRLVPAAIVDHDADPDLREFVRRFFAYGRGAARFHATGSGGSLRETAAFHCRLPALLGPELTRRGPWRGTTLVALLAVWETANLAGFLAETVGRSTHGEPPGDGTRLP